MFFKYLGGHNVMDYNNGINIFEDVPEMELVSVYINYF